MAELSPIAGDSALGGERHGREAVERWFERLFRLCPRMSFEGTRVISSGVPWDIWASAEWVGHVTPAAGEPYVSRGTHVLRIRNGRVVYFRASEDSQKVAHACERMTALGVEEAAAAPIID